jgi:RNA polymerase sigma-70 factor (ECF subfamily)
VQVHDWNRITEEHASVVWQTAYRLLHNQADAADCFQETFMAAFELTQRQHVHNIRGLLLRLATTRSIDRLRQRSRRSRQESDCDDWPHLPSAQPGPDAEAQSQELAARLRVAIGQLPPQEAKVFCLRYFNDLSYREIARELGVKTGAAGVLLHRAKGKLRQWLEPVEAEETRLPYGT